MFTFLHTADIHLDSPLRGLERYEGAPVDQIRHATRRALENLVQLAIDRSAAFVLIAGDLYDGDWREFRTGLFFVSQMARLLEARVPVYVVAGNHDAANKMTRRLPLPDNVRILSHQRPETVLLEELGAAIHGQSFARSAVRDNLAAAYPPPAPGRFNIGLLHTCAEGREGHERYAPCSIDDLRSRGYDYWALGHVHKRERLIEDPLAAFPGNPQGRHVRETGPKGCLVVTVDDRHRAGVEFQPLDVLRWEVCPVDASGLASAEDVLDQVHLRLEETAAAADGRPLAVRVRLAGACPAHHRLAAEPQGLTNEVRAVAQTVSSGDVWVEKVVDQTTPETTGDLPQAAEGPLGELIQLVEDLKHDDQGLRALAGQLADLSAKLPPELREGPEALLLDRPEILRPQLDPIRDLLVHRLLGQKEP